MELIKELNEALINEAFELNEEIVIYDENCMMILESDSHIVCDSAICFLSHLADDIKEQRITKLDKKAKTRFAIYTALELLKVKQPAPVDASTAPSIRKYMTASKEVEPKDLDEVESTLVKVLGKLQDMHHTKGTKVRDHNIELFKNEPEALLANIKKLKAKYQAMKGKM
jgi:hypothetical protein